jgi:hypothetical protein
MHEVKKHITSRVSSQRRHRSNDFDLIPNNYRERKHNTITMAKPTPWPPRARIWQMEEHPIALGQKHPTRRVGVSDAARCVGHGNGAAERKEEAKEVESRRGGTWSSMTKLEEVLGRDRPPPTASNDCVYPLSTVLTTEKTVMEYRSHIFLFRSHVFSSVRFRYFCSVPSI